MRRIYWRKRLIDIRNYWLNAAPDRYPGEPLPLLMPERLEDRIVLAAPVAVDDSASTTEDTASDPINVLTNDSDADNDVLTVTQVDGQAISTGMTVNLMDGSGTVMMDSDGYLIFTPSADYNSLSGGVSASPSPSFTYTIWDGTLDSLGNPNQGTATVAVQVNGLNDDPVGMNQTFEITENQSVTIDLRGATDSNALFSDADTNDTLVYFYNDGATEQQLMVDQSVTLISGATLTLNSNQTLTYNPNTAFDYLTDAQPDSDNFTIIARDPSTAESTSNVTINVTGVNDAPVGMDQTFNTDEDHTVSIDLRGAAGSSALFSDADTNDTLVYAYNGTALLDGVAVHLNPLDALSATITLDASSGTLTYDPRIEFDPLTGMEAMPAVDTFTITAWDGSQDTEGSPINIVTSDVTINITGLMYPQPDSATTNEDNPTAVFDVLANDGGTASDQLQVTEINGIAFDTSNMVILDQNTGESVELVTTGSPKGLRYDPGTAFNYLAMGAAATRVFTYTVEDKDGNTGVATVTITVTGLNDIPTVTTPIDDQSSADGTVISLDVSMNFDDVDNDTLTYTASGLPTGLSINSTGVISGTIAANASQSSPYTITVTVDDGHGVTASDTFIWTVSNPTPDAQDDSFSVNEDMQLAGNVLADNGNGVDADDDSLTVSTVNGSAANVGTMITLTSGATLTVNADGTFTYNPFQYLADSENMDDTFTYTISDGQGGTDSAIVTISVEGENDPPMVETDTFDTAENQDITIRLRGAPGSSALFSDVDTNDTLTYTVRVNVGGIELDYQLGSIDLVIPLDFSGTITYDQANQTLTYHQGTEFDSLSAGATGMYQFTVIALDGLNSQATANVTINVRGVNDDPVAVDDLQDGNGIPLSTNEGQALNIDVLANDTDVDGDHAELMVTQINGGAFDSNGLYVLADDKGTVMLNTDGTITFTPGSYFDPLAPGDSESLTFAYTVEDADGGSDTADVTVTVTAINNPPIANPDSYSTDEETVIRTSYMGTVESDAPLIYWRLGETSGSTATNSGSLGSAADGTYFGGVTLGVTGAVSGDTAVEFAGNNTTDYVSASSVSMPTTAISVELWVQTSSNNRVLFSYATSDSHNELLIIDPEDIQVYLNGVSIDTNIDISDDEFHHLVLTWESTTGALKLYVDGDLSFSGVLQAGLPISSGGTIILGQEQDSLGGGFNTGQAFSGKLDEVAIYGSVLNETQVQTHYQAAQIGGVLDNDTDPDSILTVTQVNGNSFTPGMAITLASGATLTMYSDGSFIYDPTTSATLNALSEGVTYPDSFTYQVSDGENTSTATVMITVTGVNDPPVVSSEIADQSSNDGQTVMFDVSSNFSDVDTSDSFTFSADNLPGGLDIDSMTGIISGMIASNASQGGTGGVYSVMVTANDGHGGSVSDTFTWTVTNLPPVAMDDGFDVSEDALQADGNELNGNVLDNDDDTPPDDDVLHVSAVYAADGSPIAVGTQSTLDKGGLLQVNRDGSFTYDPNGQFESLAVGETETETFTYMVDDGQGGTDSATVTITIIGMNDAPELQSTLTVNRLNDVRVYHNSLLTDSTRTDPPLPVPVNGDGDYLDSILEGEKIALNLVITDPDNGETIEADLYLITDEAWTLLNNGSTIERLMISLPDQVIPLGSVAGQTTGGEFTQKIDATINDDFPTGTQRDQLYLVLVYKDSQNAGDTADIVEQGKKDPGYLVYNYTPILTALGASIEFVLIGNEFEASVTGTVLENSTADAVPSKLLLTLFDSDRNVLGQKSVDSLSSPLNSNLNGILREFTAAFRIPVSAQLINAAGTELVVTLTIQDDDGGHSSLTGLLARFPAFVLPPQEVGVEIEEVVLEFQETQAEVARLLTVVRQVIRTQTPLSGEIETDTFEVLVRIVIDEGEDGEQNGPQYHYIDLFDSGESGEEEKEAEESIDQARSRLEQFLQMVPHLPDDRFQLILRQKRGDLMVSDTIILDVTVQDGEIVERQAQNQNNAAQTSRTDKLSQPAANSEVPTEPGPAVGGAEVTPEKVGSAALPILAISEYRNRLRRMNSAQNRRLIDPRSESNRRRDGGLWGTLFRVSSRH